MFHPILDPLHHRDLSALSLQENAAEAVVAP
jgi:hypothetical protein